ncbi:hypothetical protein [Novosphingobium beihaiensis]|uniref:Uncharacterized protein n=1 Tax=Novosphingobium beihaiensis TaxID=2930389 RepID=A0ABT0BUM3_9SPHN|nr:hypothetical protein [Novosphingobium beihaiensis]MCJ2188766.1 hypothetical protein [Novosphingobium beihaiensis]
MTIRFAAAWGGATPAIMRSLCRSAPLGAVNDNHRMLTVRRIARRPARVIAPVEGDGEILTEALRHFGRHGHAAAAKARSEAIAAHTGGDHKGRDRWIAICRQLDRRMASSCELSLLSEDG